MQAVDKALTISHVIFVLVEVGGLYREDHSAKLCVGGFSQLLIVCMSLLWGCFEYARFWPIWQYWLI